MWTSLLFLHFGKLRNISLSWHMNAVQTWYFIDRITSKRRIMTEAVLIHIINADVSKTTVFVLRTGILKQKKSDVSNERLLEQSHKQAHNSQTVNSEQVIIHAPAGFQSRSVSASASLRFLSLNTLCQQR